MILSGLQVAAAVLAMSFGVASVSRATGAVRGRAPLHHRLRSFDRPGQVALDARRRCRQAGRDGRQLLSDPPHPGLAALGHRRHRRGREHAGRPSRTEGIAALVSAEDARRRNRQARPEACRHPLPRDLAHASRPHRQRRAVPAIDAAGAARRIRLAVAVRAALRSQASGHQARRRSRRLRRRQRHDLCDAGTHAGPPGADGRRCRNSAR